MNISALVRNYRTLTTCTSNEDNQRSVCIEMHPTVLQTLYMMFGGQPTLVHEFVSEATGFWKDKTTGTPCGWPANDQLESLFNRINSKVYWE